MGKKTHLKFICLLAVRSRSGQEDSNKSGLISDHWSARIELYAEGTDVNVFNKKYV
jgi:hypothetical protein